MILVPRPLNGSGVIPPPAETSADVASPCFDRTGSVQALLHMQALRQRQLQKGCGWQQGGTRYGCNIWFEGTDYSAMDNPGGPLSRGDCPRCDRSRQGGGGSLPMTKIRMCQFPETQSDLQSKLMPVFTMPKATQKLGMQQLPLLNSTQKLFWALLKWKKCYLHVITVPHRSGG